MNTELILIGNGFFLSLILLLLLIVLTRQNDYSEPLERNIKEDMKKIKAHISQGEI